MYAAAPLALQDGHAGVLRQLMRSLSAPAISARRARVLLLAADGMPNSEIASVVGVSRQTVLTLRSGYATCGLDVLVDPPRSGRPSTVDKTAVVVATLNPPPVERGVTHWSSRPLSAHLTKTGMPVSFGEVARIRRDWKLQPHRVDTFKFSTHPQLTAKVHDVVGLYLNPPDNAVVVCSTALAAATSRLSADACHPRHRSEAYLAFLRLVAKANPRVPLHVVCDNDGTHSHASVKAWLTRDPRIVPHSTGADASWMGMVEVVFGLITHQAVHRGSLTAAPDVISESRRFIDVYSERCEPFTWVRTADKTLTRANRPNTAGIRC